MKIILNGKTYTDIKNLSFAPQTDITGNEAVINTFSADIMTDDDVSVGINAYLYDDLNNLWAKYWLTEAVRMKKQALHIEAKSILMLLDRKTMDAVMYNSQSVSSILSSIFSGLTNEYTLDSSFSTQRISGYCPEQSARERLQWICFCIGAYLKTFFTDRILILPVDTSLSIIPVEKTFWKPSVTYGDYVTAIKATAYTYVSGIPQNTDKWVKIGETYYIQTSQNFTLSNPEAPVTANENVVSVENVTIINTNNVSDILTLLSTYYFKRIEIDADIINNGEYHAGDKISLPIDDETFVTGYIKSTAFTFGLQAKSKIKLLQMDTAGGGTLYILRQCDGTLIGENKYFFPIGYEYSIQNPYLDRIELGDTFMARPIFPYIRVVYYPFNENATGTIIDTEVFDYEDYGEALILYNNTPEAEDPHLPYGMVVKALLHVLSVDGVTSVVEDGKVIVEVD